VPGVKTNERPGTRAVLRHCRISASKTRQVLNLIRDEEVGRASEILAATERGAATVVGKVLASAVANAVHNDGQDADELYVSACFADEGATLKRWRPRARGRASRIRKRTCHITIVVSRLPEERLARQRAEREARGAQRSRRVSESRRRADLAGRLSRRRHAQEEAEAAEAASDTAEGAEEAAAEAVEAATGESATGESVDVASEDVTAEATTEDVVAEPSGDAEAGAGDVTAEATTEDVVAEPSGDAEAGAEPVGDVANDDADDQEKGE
jgi:large subunit ribosomal protein L22